MAYTQRPAVTLLATERFGIVTAAPPGCVWDALTTTGAKVGHLYGLIVHSEWQPGSTVTAGIPCGPQLTGQVLRVDPAALLSYTLGDTLDEPAVYITWEIGVEPAGTFVRLYIDQPDPPAPQETEMVWLPMLAALERRLKGCCTDHGSTHSA